MMMTGIAVLIVLALGYVWLTRGFFSALIHLICTLIAGAIAFGVWEPLSLAILNAASPGGFTSFLGGTAWAMGLALPFAASLALLRVGVDKMLPANVNPGTVTDYIGGGLCGAASGVITAGILVISLGFLRLESGFMGATHVVYDNNGNIVRENAILVPLDKITAGFYGRLSEAAFRSGEPLAKWHPNLQDEGAALRLSFGEGRARNTTKPEDFEILERFTVGGGQTPFESLLRDSQSPGIQSVVDPDGKPWPSTTRIEGVVVNFKAGAKEKEGKFAIGASQIRLLLEDVNGQRMEVYPLAVWSQAQSDGQGWGRWRFDARDTYIATVGAGAAAKFAFEFPAPNGYNPIAVYVKGTRVRLDQGPLATPKQQLANAATRQRYIEGVSGSKTAMAVAADPTGAGAGPISDEQRMPTDGLDLKGVVKLGSGQPLSPGANIQPPDGVTVNNSIGFTIQKGTHDPLVIDDEGRTIFLIEGTKDFEADYKSKTVGLENSLRIERLAVSPDVVIFKVDVSSNSRLSLLSPAAANVDRSKPPLLFDTSGNTYTPVGYIYEDSIKITVRYTPGQPIQSMNDLPSLSRSRPEQKLTLLFQVSLGVNIQAFGVGNKILVEFDPPLPCRTPQNRG